MPDPEKNPFERLPEFLAELTALSFRFGLGIADAPILFIIEQDDFERKYRSDPNGRIEFV